MSERMRVLRKRLSLGPLPLSLGLAASLSVVMACRGQEPSRLVEPLPAATAAAGSARVHPRDLGADEARGGHTLARHVGRTDAELAERLRNEPQISAASTYPDRAKAEDVVARALDSSSDEIQQWERRDGVRPNLVLTYTNPDGPIGRCLVRKAGSVKPCGAARVILRWDSRRRNWYVLTSYPDTP